METRGCGHPADAGQRRLCGHLLRVDDDGAPAGYLGLLRGVGVDYDAICPACAEPDVAVELVVACAGCVTRVEEHLRQIGWRGTPGILERPEPVDTALLRSQLPVPAPLLDIAPVAAHPGEWLLLTDHQVVRWRVPDAGAAMHWPIELPDEREPTYDNTLRRRIYAAPDGRFAAVVSDYGRYGFVLDLTSGAVTMRLDRQDYLPDVTPFPVAFVVVDGDLLLAHATDWNRLDLSDPATGELRTARLIGSPQEGVRPEHYLDYFHGGLFPSPDGRWLADDGWAWHPVGIPTVWDAQRWRRDNTYESEDGHSRHDLTVRSYYWNAGLCWLTADRLAVFGIGDDDETMLDGIVVYDPRTGDQVTTLAGPAGALMCDGNRLYATAADGLTIWDPATGARTGRVAEFQPTHHHPGSGELAAVVDGLLVRWPIPTL